MKTINEIFKDESGVIADRIKEKLHDSALDDINTYQKTLEQSSGTKKEVIETIIAYIAYKFNIKKEEYEYV